jgi:hypothetical protein
MHHPLLISNAIEDPANETKQLKQNKKKTKKKKKQNTNLSG